VLAGYLGTVLAYNHQGFWKTDEEHPLPYVYFKKHDFAVSPFDVIRKKLLAPQHFDLVAHYNDLLWQLKQLDEGKSATRKIPEVDEPGPVNPEEAPHA
jgi:hypothetical protein